MRLCMNDEARGHPDVNANLPTIFKSLQRSQAEGMKRALLNDSVVVDVKTKAGIYLGKREAFRVDLPRIFKVVDRVVRGLNYHETGKRFPDGYGIRVDSDETLREDDPETLKFYTETIINPLAHTPRKEFGANAFSYRYAPTDREGHAAWALTFYGSISFVALTSCEPLPVANE
jgi:hypothetical protein